MMQYTLSMGSGTIYSFSHNKYFPLTNENVILALLARRSYFEFRELLNFVFPNGRRN